MESWKEYITITPGVRSGKPCIKGTRIMVRDILGWLSLGMTFEEIHEDFPQIDDNEIKTALAYSSEL